MTALVFMRQPVKIVMETPGDLTLMEMESATSLIQRATIRSCAWTVIVDDAMTV